MNLGSRISELRNQRGLTQEELANKLEITRAALSHYENNRREPDHETIQNIADFFNVSVDYLLGRVDEAHSALQPEMKEFISSLELSDQHILSQFNFTIDGKPLTPAEAKRFIAFVRAERTLE